MLFQTEPYISLNLSKVTFWLQQQWMAGNTHGNSWILYFIHSACHWIDLRFPHCVSKGRKENIRALMSWEYSEQTQPSYLSPMQLLPSRRYCFIKNSWRSHHQLWNAIASFQNYHSNTTKFQAPWESQFPKLWMTRYCGEVSKHNPHKPEHFNKIRESSVRPTCYDKVTEKESSLVFHKSYFTIFKKSLQVS